MKTNRNTASNNGGNWNHLRIIQKLPALHMGTHEIKKLQKRTVLGTAYVLRKVRM